MRRPCLVFRNPKVSERVFQILRTGKFPIFDPCAIRDLWVGTFYAQMCNICRDYGYE